MKKILFVLFSIIAVLTSCDDTTDKLGGTLTRTEDLLTVSDGIYTVTSRSVVVDSVISRSIDGYLGNIKDPETGTYIKSNFLTQFHTYENFEFPEKEMLANGIIADSCHVRLFYNTFYGDSLTSMKATLYEMATPVEEGTTYYSSFNPEKAGALRKDANSVNVTKYYTLADCNYTDSMRATSSYANNIAFDLNAPYTDKEGKTYNNYGTYVMQKYYENPDNFKNSYNFIHNVCPGFYIKSENGVGSMATIYLTQLNIYTNIKDTTTHVIVANFSGTEEVRQITEIENSKDRIKQLAEDKTCTYIKSPAGLFTELTLPVEDIFNGHENDSINSAKLALRCISNNDNGQYAFNTPSTLLMVRVDDAKAFFENNEISNNRTSYIATYSKTANNYSFNNIGLLARSMYDNLPKDAVARELYKKENPSWNKVLLIPVKANYTTYNSTSIVSRISHDMSLSSIRLVGGEESAYGDITLSVIYSKFNR